MEIKDKYYLEHFIDIRFGDPISALKLECNNYVIAGTMLGRLSIYDLYKKKIYVLSELSSENISGISYNESEKSFYIGIGDEEIKQYQDTGLTTDSYQSISINDSEVRHTQNCENSFIFISPISFLRVQLYPVDDGTLEIMETENEFEIKFLDSKTTPIKGKIPMTNYSVPFDFNGKAFLWVEFLKEGNYNICFADLTLSTKSEDIYKHKIVKNKGIGHISFAKILPENQIFIVHSLNKCEIRLLNDNFSLIDSYVHYGNEVYAVDLLYDERDDYTENQLIYDDRVISNQYNLGTNIKYSEKIALNKNKQKVINNNNLCDMILIKSNLQKKKTLISNNKVLCIITLDIDGNVNLYKENKERTLFNLYNIRDISEEQKDKQFFSLGYNYFIQSNLNYFCISTDHGCYIIKQRN